MSKYAQIHDSKVVEVMTLPSGIALSDAFHADVATLYTDCPAKVEAGWTYDGKTFTAPEAVAVDLAAIKAAAVTQLSTMLDAAANVLTGASPIAERLSWAVKQEAARAYQAGNAAPEQLDMLRAEAGLTAETLDDLAATILGAASSYWSAAGAIAGLRRTIGAAIDAAETAEAVQAVLIWAQNQIETAFGGSN